MTFPPVGMLQRKVEEVTQVFEDHRRTEQEHSIRIAFDWMTVSSACCFGIIHYLQIVMMWNRVVFTINYLIFGCNEVSMWLVCFFFFSFKYCAVENYTVVWLLILADHNYISPLGSRQQPIRCWLRVCNLYLKLS